MALTDPHQVDGILRDVAERIILPRFRKLEDQEIREKNPGDLVTVADTEAEAALSERLCALLPGSQVVGEEAVAADPAILERLEQPGTVWILDPVDGTRNFVHGRPKFAIIVALVRNGRAVQGWIHDPLAGRTAIAEAGAGAYVGDRRLRLAPSPPLGRMAGSIGPRRPADLARAVGQLQCQGSTAHDYLDLLEGRLHFAYFRRLHPWDHAAGLLAHAEAGGVAAYFDGAPYRPIAGQTGLLVAPDRPSWEDLKDLLAETLPK